MKRTPIWAMILLLLSACGPRARKVERTFENGVEVVINRLEPHTIKGQKAALELKKEFSIDFSREELAALGLADVYNFNVDPRGNIYVLNARPVDYFIFAFDANGLFLRRFGKKGQGPGELQWTSYLAFDSQDNIVVSDPEIRKNVVFDPKGNLIGERPFPKDAYVIYLIDNNKYISYWRKWTSPNDDYFTDYFGLTGPGMEGVHILDSCQWPNPAKHGIRGNRLNRVFNWKASGDRIYIGNEERDYEFLVFDWDGNLQRKIRKVYKPVEVRMSDEDKKKISAERPGLAVAFPKFWPPFGSFFVDDENRLYVQTYETGDSRSGYIYDIYSEEGILMLRQSLPVKPAVDIEGDALARSGRLYCVQEDEFAYKTLAVYRMNWKD
jgi:6-bladed beta-propeller